MYKLLLVFTILGMAVRAEIAPKDGVSKKFESSDFSPWTAPLTDQYGHQLKLEDIGGRHLLVTGLYTTCMNPAKCPLVAKWVQEAEVTRLKSPNNDKVRIVVISFDPNDTPETLAEYSRENQWGNGVIFAKVNGGAKEVETFFRSLGFRLSVGEGGVSIHAVQMKFYDPQRHLLESSDRKVMDWSKVLESVS
ncbi:MAG: SCO family protein [Verrucomicrobiota bacterium]